MLGKYISNRLYRLKNDWRTKVKLYGGNIGGNEFHYFKYFILKQYVIHLILIPQRHFTLLSHIESFI